MNQFPQPTRPINSYNSTQMSPDLYQSNYFNPTEFQERVDSNSSGVDTAAEEKKAIEDLLRVISEWYEKLPESISNKINMAEFSAATRGVDGGIQTIVQNFQRLREEANSSRGIDGGDEELEKRLDRFRVRIVELGGVVKEEEKRQ